MKKLIAVLLCSSLCSCVVMQEKTANGDVATYASLGGRGAYRKGVGLVHDHQKSFRDAMVAAGLAISAAQAAHSVASTEATKQVVEKEGTVRTINASNNAAAIEQARIAADVTKATFVP